MMKWFFMVVYIMPVVGDSAPPDQRTTTQPKDTTVMQSLVVDGAYMRDGVAFVSTPHKYVTWTRKDCLEMRDEFILRRVDGAFPAVSACQRGFIEEWARAPEKASD
jgi:hypothetical protein